MIPRTIMSERLIPARETSLARYERVRSCLHTRTLATLLAISSIALICTSSFMMSAHAQETSGPCSTVNDKQATPAEIDLGDSVTITLSVSGDCPELERKSDVVLVLDVSSSMTGAKGQAVEQAAAQFVDLMDPRLVQIGIVTFSDTPTRVIELSTDYLQVKNEISTLKYGHNTNIVDGLATGVDMVLGPKHRGDATPVIIFLSDGDHNVNPVFGTMDEVIELLQSSPIETYAIGIDGADRWLLRRIAGTRSRFIEEPDPDLIDWAFGDIARRIQSTVLFQSILIEDVIPENMTYVRGSAIPDAFFDQEANTLVWELFDVPMNGESMLYRVIPQDVGLWPTNVRASGEYRDGSSHNGEIVFPVPEVLVRGGDRPAECVCKITYDKVPIETINRALTVPEKIAGWNKLHDENKPGSPLYPMPGYDSPPNPRRTCLDIQNRAISFHPLFNGVIWRAGCLEGPANP